MSYCAYFLFALWAMSSMSMAVDEFRLLQTFTSIDNETADTVVGKEQNEMNIQKSYTTFEKDNIVQTMNNLRRTVKASDMTYMYWSTAMENDAITYTAKCNYDASVATNGWGIVQAKTSGIDAVASLKQAFANSEFYYGMRSVYFLGIGVNIRFCTTARVDGLTHSNIYIGAYIFSYTSTFNDNYQQYAIGTACTACRSYVFWCDDGLCRGACSSEIYTCSCFESCTNCGDWNTESCTCPSQPYTGAVTLGCNKGETTYKARNLWATIVMSTLALFYLQ